MGLKKPTKTEKLQAKASEDSDFYYQFKKMNENPSIDSGMPLSFFFSFKRPNKETSEKK